MILSWNDARNPVGGEALALALEGLGVAAGHRIAILTGNTPLHAALHLLARQRGWSLVPFNARRPPADLAQALAWTAWDVAVADPAHYPLAMRHRAERPVVEASVRGDPLQVHAGKLGAPGPPGVCWLETSGTSGAPRRVAVSRAMLDAHAGACKDRIRDGPDSVWLAVLPMHHVGGVALTDRWLRNGCTLVLEERFDVERIATRMEVEEVTHASFVPTMLRRLLDAKCRPPASLRCVLVGGDSAPDDLVRQAIGQGWPVHCTYGLTEACSQVATATPQERVSRPGTSGRPLDGVRVSIEDGEIVVAGPTVVGGGPLRTGDLGRLDQDGYLYFMGRARDVIVTGGEKVVPRDVERAIETHPAVAAACVVGIPDEEWGQRVVAAVTLRSDLADVELARHVRALVAAHMVPKEWRRLETMPRTDSGKLRRAAVRDAWIHATVPT